MFPYPRLLSVSIHAFREGRRLPRPLVNTGAVGFQSTPSAREGDQPAQRFSRRAGRFNPRLPRGKATLILALFCSKIASFNPRLPRGKATPPVPNIPDRFTVSIHAFREGRRRQRKQDMQLMPLFQSTPSAREGDVPIARQFPPSGVSIHAFREGRRLVPATLIIVADGFNPRLPRGKATIQRYQQRRQQPVSIHAFREGRRPSVAPHKSQTPQFQSTPSAREGDCIVYTLTL